MNAQEEAPSLEAKMSAYQRGDLPAFDSLYRELSPKIFGYLLRLTRSRSRAEDLCQITFSKMHRARHSYLEGAPLLPWVFAIARRSFLDECRKIKARPYELSHDGQVPEGSIAPEQGDFDLADAVEKALGRISFNYAEAIQLTKLSGLSLDEAATILGCSKTAVKLRVHRGYQQLKKELGEFDAAL